MPKSLDELKSEIDWQYLGIRGLVEDTILRSKNRVELVQGEGKLAVITGGNRGIGLRVVEKLLMCNMSVVMAGIMASPYKLTEDGFESQLAVNYLGHFLLTHLLFSHLKSAGSSELSSRVVNVSSCVHLHGSINFDDINGKKGYYPPVAYNQSKLAQVLFTRYLQKRLDNDPSAHIKIYAVHPGVVDTDLFCHSSTTYIPWFKKLFFKTPEEGSRTIVHAAISPKLEEKGGSYLSNCTLVKISPLAKDLCLGEKFFNFTSDMLGIQEFGIA